MSPCFDYLSGYFGQATRARDPLIECTKKEAPEGASI